MPYERELFAIAEFLVHAVAVYTKILSRQEAKNRTHLNFSPYIFLRFA